ncbi:MAG: urea amidolyase family protein [Thermoanaerobaculia bacterium]
MKLAQAGDHAVLIELDRDITARDLHAAANRVRAGDGVLACIAGHSSLYVVFENLTATPAVLTAAVLDSPLDGAPAPARTHHLRVSFLDQYAPDLPEFLTRVAISREAFFRRIRDLRLVVRYLGFRGGFAYLDGWVEEWAIPRRETSRPVARGSFGIAGGVAGFYPIDSPGGWNILGRTAEEIEHRFAPGDEITIEPTSDVVSSTSRDPVRQQVAGIVAPFMVRLGPPNWSNLERGLPVGGPFDIEAARAANTSVGLPADAPLFEFAQVGPRVTADVDAFLGWCDLRGVRVERVRRDQTFDFGRIGEGLRGYLAIGSRPGRAGTLSRDDRRVIRTMRGPHDIGVDEIECEVTPSIDRVGIRMKTSSAELRRYGVRADLPSIGMQFGSLQLHPDGSIVAMGPDHPVTGGYLQPMTVLWPERWKLAHLAPGERVRFVAQ